MEKVQRVHKRTETDNEGRTVIHWFIQTQKNHHALTFFKKFPKVISFFEEDNVASYADDTIPYSNSKNVVTILENIETKEKEVFN